MSGETIDNLYLDSDKVKVFPFSNARGNYDPYCRVLSEQNITSLVRHSTNFPSYVISEPSDVTVEGKQGYFVEFVINGYYFSATILKDNLKVNNVYSSHVYVEAAIISNTSTNHTYIAGKDGYSGEDNPWDKNAADSTKFYSLRVILSDKIITPTDNLLYLLVDMSGESKEGTYAVPADSLLRYNAKNVKVSAFTDAPEGADTNLQSFIDNLCYDNSAETNKHDSTNADFVYEVDQSNGKIETTHKTITSGTANSLKVDQDDGNITLSNIAEYNYTNGGAHAPSGVDFVYEVTQEEGTITPVHRTITTETTDSLEVDQDDGNITINNTVTSSYPNVYNQYVSGITQTNGINTVHKTLLQGTDSNISVITTGEGTTRVTTIKNIAVYNDTPSATDPEFVYTVTQTDGTIAVGHAEIRAGTSNITVASDNVAGTSTPYDIVISDIATANDSGTEGCPFATNVSQTNGVVSATFEALDFIYCGTATDVMPQASSTPAT